MFTIFNKIVTLPLFLLLVASPRNEKKHPLHVSTSEFNFNQQEKTIEITTAIFTDDFEKILRKKYQQKVDLISIPLHKKMDELVKNYLISNLSVKLNGNPSVINYVGYEINHEVVNIYTEIDGVTDMKTLEVANTLLYDLFDDQMSIVHVIKIGVRKSNKLLFPDRICKVSF